MLIWIFRGAAPSRTLSGTPPGYFRADNNGHAAGCAGLQETGDLKQRLIGFAQEAGLPAVGVCRPDAVPELPERLEAFVDAGMHGQMGWMAERMAWRGDPTALWPEAKSVIMLAEPYTPEHDPLAVLAERDRAAISVYAQNRDYHDVVKKRLKRVGRWLIEQVPEAEIKVFVDTAPVMEKPLAQAAGLGWQGKHTNLAVPRSGELVFSGCDFYHGGSGAGCRPRTAIVGLAPPVWISARRGRFLRLTGWMRGGAFPI